MIQQYNTLDDIARCKAETLEKRRERGEQIEKLWGEISTPRPAGSRAELITGIISKSIVAFDTFLLVRKLSKQYGSFFAIFKKKKKK